jgi:tripartite-type tricarboxylate transporter receptor subunit TctC
MAMPRGHAMNLSRRRVLHLAVGGAAALPALSRVAGAQSYPSRPITIVVPFSAGGPTDVMARILGQHMSQTLGQSIIVENVVGAGGTSGTARVARASPDGYTMVMGNLGTHAASVGIYKNLPYDPRISFEPVILVGSTPMVLVVKNALPVETLTDFIAYASNGQQKIAMGSAGTGSISHLTLLLFSHLTKTEFQHVPYRGLSQAVNDLLGGQIDAMFDQVVTASPHILAGSEKALVVTTPGRAAAIPKVPSSAEAGLPELQVVAWTALFVPKGTPHSIVERINAAADRAMQDETTAKRLADLGAELPAAGERSALALASLVRSEIDRWVPLIQAAGVGEN